MKSFTIIVSCVIMLCSVAGCSEKNNSPTEALSSSSTLATSPSVAEIKEPTNSPDYDECLTYIKKNAVDPSDYVINKLKDHDIVILGQYNQIGNNFDFITENISKLYHEGGVRVFATQYAYSRNTDILNEIVTAKEFDYDRVVDVYRDFWFVMGGVAGYTDIIQAIWDLNNSLSENDEKMKIIALGYELQDWSGARAEPIGNYGKYMADIFINSYGDGATGKAIITMEFNLSFSKFMGYGYEAGHYLRLKYWDRMFEICMHCNYNTSTQVKENDFYISNFLNDIYRDNGSRPIGFDVVGSPFENIRDDVTHYFLQDDNTALGDLTKGYIVLSDSHNFSTTPFIDNFVNESNFEKAKELARTNGWFEFEDTISIDEFNKKLTACMNH